MSYFVWIERNKGYYIRFLSAINGARNNTSNCQLDLHEAEYFFLGNIVLCGLNAEISYVGWRLF